MSVGELTVSIIGDMTKLSQTFSQVNKDLETVGTKISTIGKNLSSAGQSLTMGITGPIVAAGAVIAGVTDQAVDFEKGMAQVFTLIPGMSKNAMDSMTQDVLNFSKENGVLTDEVLPALYDAIGSGVPPENVFTFLQVAQKGAVAAATDIGTAVNGLTSIINAYGSENISAAEASDILFAGINVGKMTYEELSKSLYEVIPTASSLGIGLDEVTAALATMTAQGTPTTVATDQLRQMFVELSKEGSGASAAFKELTGKSFYEFIQSGGTVSEAIQILKDGMVSAVPDAEAMQKAMFDLADPTSGLALEFESLTGKTFAEFQKAGGTVEEALSVLGLDFTDTKERVSDYFGSVEAGNTILSLSAQDGKIYAKSLDAVGESAGSTEKAYKLMSETSSKSLQNIKAELDVLIVQLGTDFLPVLEDTLVPLIKDTLVPALEIVVPIIGKMAKVFNELPQPVKLVILGIVAFLAALGPVLVVLGSMITAVGTVAGLFGAGGGLAVAMAWVSSTLLPALASALGLIISPLGLIAVAVAALYLAWTNNWFGIRDKAQVVWDWLKTQANALWQQMEYTYHAIIMSGATLKTQFGAAWDAIKNAFSTIAGMIVSLATNFYNGLASVYNSILVSVSDLKTQIVARWTEIKTGILTKLNEIISDSTAWLANQKAKFVTAINDLSNLKTQISTAWAEIKAGILAKLNEIISDLSTWISNQQARFSTAISNLTTFKTNAIARWTEIKTAILTKLNEIITELQNWISKQKDKFNQAVSAVNDLKTRITKAFSEMVSAIKTKVTEIVNSVAELPKKILALGTSMYNAGKEIVQKLIDGLKSKLQDIKNTVSEITKLSSIANSEAAKSVKSAGTGVINTIKDTGAKAKVTLAEAATGLKRLLPSSPAKEGPFKTLPNWDAVFLDPLTKSISGISQLSSPLSSALSGIKSPLNASTSAGLHGFSNVNTSNSYGGDTLVLENVNINNGMDVQAIFTQFETWTAQKKRARGIL